MVNWLKRRRSTEHAHPQPVDDASARPAPSVKSAPQDLLGFSLPVLARLSESWWTSPAHDDARLADSWVLASRTARPNLRALTVAFERVP